MALWMDEGSMPATDSERADLEAIDALKQSAALELKEEGNKYVKMGKKHYKDAINCYTRAINQKALSDVENSVLHANRAHVNLLIGNNRSAFQDAEEAIRLSSTNIKAYYRAAKAALSLGLVHEAASFCQRGLEHSPCNEELQKLSEQVDARKQADENHKAEVSKAISAAKELVSAIENRGLKFGEPQYQELTGVKKPWLDGSGVLHWPVVLFYAEAMSCDLIEDFCETDLFSAHLDLMFSESSPPLSWDKENAYKRDAIELYYQPGTGTKLSRRKMLKYFLEGTAASLADIDTENVKDAKLYPENEMPSSDVFGKFVKVNERKMLYEVLQRSDYIIPGIPVFFVVSNRSSFYRKFKDGAWSVP